MKLFRYELRKLLLNKRSIIFIALLTLFYLGIGIGNSIFTFQEDSSFSEYSMLADKVTGPLDETVASSCSTNIDQLMKIFGSEHSVKRRSAKDSNTKLDFEYTQFANRVNAYYNGTSNDDKEDPTGIEPLKAKLKELEDAGKTDTYQYKKLDKRLNKMLALGAPEFENVVLWNTLYEGWNGLLILFLLFIPLAFLISSVFTKEVSTGMDNLILSSVKGRTAMVFAKLGAASICCVVVTFLYFIATFVGNFLPYMSLKGATASVRSLNFMSGATFDMSILSFALLTVLWVLLAALVFTAIITLISSLLKNHATVFGLSILVLLLGIVFEALGSSIVEKVQLIVDFCFTNTISVSTMFGGIASYNILGFSVPYWLLCIVVFLVLAIVSAIALIRQQHHRTIA
ncbi:ABC transporter permease subunit [Anaerosporobacter faecicola]|uniref:ABC transporter permease subunit n=1 Tax=Anaerosporobacter faecicola TaxID=2718714 RepID=UPI0014393273|nr:ABC transporter permease subunit [Anaerosporobacter faecicola]